MVFGLGVLLFFANWWVSSATMDLTWPARILVIIALALIMYDVCTKLPKPPALLKEETIPEANNPISRKEATKQTTKPPPSKAKEIENPLITFLKKAKNQQVSDQTAKEMNSLAD